MTPDTTYPSNHNGSARINSKEARNADQDGSCLVPIKIRLKMEIHREQLLGNPVLTFAKYPLFRRNDICRALNDYHYKKQMFQGLSNHVIGPHILQSGPWLCVVCCNATATRIVHDWTDNFIDAYTMTRNENGAGSEEVCGMDDNHVETHALFAMSTSRPICDNEACGKEVIHYGEVHGRPGAACPSRDNLCWKSYAANKITTSRKCPKCNPFSSCKRCQLVDNWLKVCKAQHTQGELVCNE